MEDTSGRKIANIKNVKLNLLKGFACIGVVFIHIQFPALFGQIIRYLAGFAVPIFYMTSGYYDYKKGEDVIRCRLFKIVKIFIVGYCYFFLYQIIYNSLNHTLGTWFADNFNWLTPVKYIVFCTIDFAIPLWYLIAMIEVYICWLIIVKKGKEQTAIAIMPVLFILRMILTGYCETVHLEWFWKINFLTDGMSWFLLGYYLHSPKSKWIRDLSSLKLVIMAAAGGVLVLFPAVVNPQIRMNVIGIIPYSLALFALTLKSPGDSICKPMEFIGEKLSLYLYILHLVIAYALEAILTAAGFDVTNSVYAWMKPVIVLAIALTAAYIVYSILERRNQKAATRYFWE